MSDATLNKTDQDDVSSSFVYPGLLLPFALIVACFAAWGISTDLTAPMVNVFSSVFDMSAFPVSYTHLTLPTILLV